MSCTQYFLALDVHHGKRTGRWEDIKTLDDLTRRKYLHDYADEVALVAGAFLPVGMLADPEELDQFWDAVDDCVFGKE